MSVYITPGTRRVRDRINGKAPARSFLLRWWKSAVRGWQKRKMIAALVALDDRILLDIGLCRGDIDDFVDGLSSAELRMVPVAPELASARQDRSYADLRRAA